MNAYQSIGRFLVVAACALPVDIGSAQQQAESDQPAKTNGPTQARAKLLKQADLAYLGAFRVPEGQHGDSQFSYGGTAIAHNPANDSLFVVGHDHQQAIAEIQIPTIKTGPLAELEKAKLLQPFQKVAPRIPNYTLEDTVKVGGLLVVENELVGTLFEYYDGDGDAVNSHFKYDSLDLAKAKVTGLFQLGQQGAGFVAGYMAPVPEDWRKRLGVKYLTGQAALSIISRTSLGPCVLGFDPSSFGPRPAPVVPLLHYPLATPLAPADTKNAAFNLTTEIRGVVFPAGTDCLLFFGSHGIGPYGYGTGEECNDKIRGSKGPHAPPYVYQVWAYDANDLVAVRTRRKLPWQLKPYAIWTFDLPYREDSKHIGGVAYDQRTGRIYVSQLFADVDRPVMHVFKVDESN